MVRVWSEPKNCKQSISGLPLYLNAGEHWGKVPDPGGGSPPAFPFGFLKEKRSKKITALAAYILGIKMASQNPGGGTSPHSGPQRKHYNCLTTAHDVVRWGSSQALSGSYRLGGHPGGHPRGRLTVVARGGHPWWSPEIVTHSDHQWSAMKRKLWYSWVGEGRRGSAGWHGGPAPGGGTLDFGERFF